jgi:hypothetical protein
MIAGILTAKLRLRGRLAETLQYDLTGMIGPPNYTGRR